MKLSSVFKPRYAAATVGTVGAAAKNAPIAARFPPSREELMRCRPGSIRGLDDIFPASLRKATIDPVNVTPPFTVTTSAVSPDTVPGREHTDEYTKVRRN